MRQLIIARKDLQMSPGKLAAQCCHASLAFLTDPIGMGQGVEPIEKDGEITGYRAEIMLEKATYEEWFDGSFTKTVCGAKNRNQLLKAKTIAEELGLVENKDFFLIRDACHTELEPEEFDENGEGMTLTCIGFRPLPDEIAHLPSAPGPSLPGILPLHRGTRSSASKNASWPTPPRSSTPSIICPAPSLAAGTTPVST